MITWVVCLYRLSSYLGKKVVGNGVVTLFIYACRTYPTVLFGWSFECATHSLDWIGLTISYRLKQRNFYTLRR